MSAHVIILPMREQAKYNAELIRQRSRDFLPPPPPRGVPPRAVEKQLAMLPAEGENK